MKIAILGKPFSERIAPFIQKLFDELLRRNTDIMLVEHFQLYLQNTLQIPNDIPTFKRGDDLTGVDVVLSIGGDGTLLDTVTYVGAQQIPILGINTGRLGFLATISHDSINVAIDALYKGHYTLDDRALIRVDSDQEVFDGINFGLNEFSVLKRDSSSMIAVHTYIDGEYLNSYWADGLVVATPTGSTGYSLSAGGPLVLPQTNNFIISPVCPHNLNVRPMIVSDRSVISFEVEGRSSSYLASLDSRSVPVDMNVQLAVRRENFVARLVKLHHVNFLSTLRSKLNWGMDNRNLFQK
ncbi:NAD kinase [Pontibacter sp. BT310]|uniref:NAD kinase n=1 Tax=Pontibacter populi TaxID=890055 RepID=A0ABS6XFP6_9BACT|nr:MULTISPECIES: NAD kinase [Pontibacter]MBJ6119956.1 NAD kinase [Pontibacter sp. BT310]MBR0572385.1 NAD kinase [Microvirga sp. STS03]MBW3366809.1 NAD kinase [Pontibacter populi]